MQPSGTKQTQSQGVRNSKQFLAAFQVMAFEKGGACQAQQQHPQQNHLVLCPEKGTAIDQHIAQRAAAKGGKKPANADANDIHAFAHGRQHARDSESSGSQELQAHKRMLTKCLDGDHKEVLDIGYNKESDIWAGAGSLDNDPELTRHKFLASASDATLFSHQETKKPP